MKNFGHVLAALVCFAVGFAALWIGRTELAKSPLLMTFVSFWLLMGFLFALRADTTGNLKVLAQNVPLLRGVANAEQSITDAPVAPASDGKESTHA